MKFFEQFIDTEHVPQSYQTICPRCSIVSEPVCSQSQLLTLPSRLPQVLPEAITDLYTRGWTFEGFPISRQPAYLAASLSHTGHCAHERERREPPRLCTRYTGVLRRDRLTSLHLLDRRPRGLVALLEPTSYPILLRSFLIIHFRLFTNLIRSPWSFSFFSIPFATPLSHEFINFEGIASPVPSPAWLFQAATSLGRV